MTDGPNRDEGARDDADGTEFTHREGEAPTTGVDEGKDATIDDGDANGGSTPFADLAATVADDDRDRSSAPDFDELFDRHDAADVDADRLWERLEADGLDSSESEGALRPVDRDVREIEKRAYCHGCEHFAEPPAVACTREGTEILAAPTMATFRVADCPIVREDDALEGE